MRAPRGVGSTPATSERVRVRQAEGRQLTRGGRARACRTTLFKSRCCWLVGQLLGACWREIGECAFTLFDYPRAVRAWHIPLDSDMRRASGAPLHLGAGGRVGACLAGRRREADRVRTMNRAGRPLALEEKINGQRHDRPAPSRAMTPAESRRQTIGVAQGNGRDTGRRTYARDWSQKTMAAPLLE